MRPFEEKARVKVNLFHDYRLIMIEVYLSDDKQVRSVLETEGGQRNETEL